MQNYFTNYLLLLFLIIGSTIALHAQLPDIFPDNYLQDPIHMEVLERIKKEAFSEEYLSELNDNRQYADLSLNFNSFTGSSPERTADSLALVALYNATGGVNWNITWDLNSSMNTWFGVNTNADGRVTSLFLRSNNLIGQLPPEIGALNELTSLSASNNSLTGVIPSEIGQMNSLTSISMYSNSFTGNIPAEIGQLVNLTSLQLYNNSLSGNIPAEISNLEELTFLNLDDNFLSGNIPPQIKALKKLGSLSIQNNNLNGSIPVEIGELTSLTFLSFNNNALSGQLPTEIGELVNLSSFSAQNNSLSGTLPTSLGSLSKLFYLSLGNNSFNGTIPVSLGDLTSLRFLYLNDNALNGSIPSTLGQLEGLYVLGLSDNILDGNIPSEIGNLKELTFTYLNENLLNGSIPSTLGQLSELITLDLSENILTGDLPIELGNLYNLNRLYLHDNNISGCFPNNYSSLCDITTTFDNNPSLVSSDLNAFCADGTGACCTTLPDLLINNITITDYDGSNLSYEVEYKNFGVQTATFTDLKVNFYQSSDTYLDLGDIEVYEQIIPAGVLEAGETASVTGSTTFNGQVFSHLIVNINQDENVEECEYQNNSLAEEIPCTFLRSLDSLALVALYHSTDGANWSQPWDLTQPMDTWNGINLDFDGCVNSLTLFFRNLSGTLPVEMGNLNRVERINIFGNYQLTGVIPVSLGNIISLSSLTLSATNLSSTIPVELSQLTNLRFLSLENNELSGEIPMELSQLTQLFNLELSDNNLMGSIPAALASLENLTYLELRDNQLTGPIPPEFKNFNPSISLFLQNNQLSGCYPPMPDDFCTLGVYSTETFTGYRLDNNPALPWSGDYSRFCAGEDQIGAPCDDSDEGTIEDVITSDCGCLGRVPDITFIVTPPGCQNEMDGSIIAQPMDGRNVIADPAANGYTILWNDGNEDFERTNLPAGTYTATVTKPNSEVVSESIELNLASPPIFDLTHRDETCPNSNDALVQMGASGGNSSGNYTFELFYASGELRNSAFTGGYSIFGVDPGAYRAAVTDNNNCTVEETFTIGIAKEFEITNTTIIEPTCANPNAGSIEISVGTIGESPVGDWVFEWFQIDPDFASLTSIDNGNISKIENLEMGEYRVRIMDEDPEGCELEVDFILEGCFELRDCKNPLVIIDDNFDNFIAGPLSAQSSNWTTRSGTEGGMEDGIVSTDHSSSGSKSLKIEGGSGQDVFLPLPDYFQGHFMVTWKMYIPSGKSAYYNVQHNAPPGASRAYELHFASDEQGTFTVGGETHTFEYPQAEWITVQQIIDVNHNLATLHIDGQFIDSWPFNWQVHIKNGVNRLSGFSFFPATDNDLFYIDNVSVQQIPNADPFEYCQTAQPAIEGFNQLQIGDCFGGTINISQDTRGRSAAWYTYTPSTDGVLNVSSCNSTSDSRLWILKGEDCTSYEIIGGNDDQCTQVDEDGLPQSSFASLREAVVKGGEQYYIVWDNRWDNEPFQFELNFTEKAGEAGQFPQTAIPVTPDTYDIISIDGNAVVGNQEIRSVSSSTTLFKQSKWYIYQPDQDETITISACSASNDTEVYIHTGDISTLLSSKLVASDDNGCSGRRSPQLSDIPVIAGETYYIEWVLIDENENIPFSWDLSSEVTIDVTFSVDASLLVRENERAEEGLFLAGTFNGFASQAMTEGEDNIWTLTIPLVVGETYNYKYLNGNNFESIETTEENDCTTGAFRDRSVLVDINNPTLATVCYAQCTSCAQAAPLAVDINDFQATRIEQDVLLNWTIENATNFSHYNIQRSTDTRNWRTIGQQLHKNTAQYQYLDKQVTSAFAANTQLYYRLEMINTDGSIEYSPIRNITLDKEMKTLMLFPNPTTGKVTIGFTPIQSTDKPSIEIINTAGQVVKNILLDYTDDYQQLQLNLIDLPRGLYLLRVPTNDGILSKRLLLN